MRITRLPLFFVAACILLTVGCASQLQLPQQVRVSLEEHYENLFCDWVVEGEDWKKEQEEGMGLL